MDNEYQHLKALRREYCQYLQTKLANIKYELLDPQNDDNSYFYSEFRSDEQGLLFPHKYNNEVEGGNKVEEFQDAVYESQIIALVI